MLDPYGWFECGHDNNGGEFNMDGVWIPGFKAGTFVWSLALAVARIIIEEIRLARQKWT